MNRHVIAISLYYSSSLEIFGLTDMNISINYTAEWRVLVYSISCSWIQANHSTMLPLTYLSQNIVDSNFAARFFKDYLRVNGRDLKYGLFQWQVIGLTKQIRDYKIALELLAGWSKSTLRTLNSVREKSPYLGEEEPTELAILNECVSNNEGMAAVIIVTALHPWTCLRLFSFIICLKRLFFSILPLLSWLMWGRAPWTGP